ncbi:MAG: endonuclease/exonuclease/phosphatase family protein [Muribaculaceae bacterium]|nr:endonuclease/exonuclease/phosphatase family protein [Muribaculaceae bacterium]
MSREITPAKPQAPARRKPESRKDRPGVWKLFVRGVFIVLGLICSVILLACGYSGYINPTVHGGYWGALGLAFPFALAATLLLIIFALIFWRRGAIIPALAMLACWGPILDYCPLHVLGRTAPEGSRILRVMTYNVCSFEDQHPEQNEASGRNRTLSTILNSGADIVCLQETETFVPWGNNLIKPQDMQRLSEIYPYILRTDVHMMLLSKYPTESVRLNLNRKKFGADCDAFRVHIDEDMDLTVFNLHLQSLGLNKDDKELYKGLAQGNTDELRNEISLFKTELLSKVAAACVSRAGQADTIAQFVDRFGGPNVLVCGDFNDVSDCYAIRRLRRTGLREVYPEVGFGPIITFNADYFYFGIDHVLYKGDLRPLSLTKGTIPSSDHYPLTVEFEIKRKK